ncbi:MAG: HAD-IIIA family hydrolase [Acidobacteria bacterium]|nr:HAD-IIIA family hydrolase [Acidobacteriota bacterium]
MTKSKTALTRRARKIKLLLTDVDGVLTDGSISLLSEPDGSAREIKTFNSQDGAGLRLIQQAGVRTGIITGRASAAVAYRARELKMEFVEQNVFEKLPAYQRILTEAGLKDEQVCFVGDDITDLPLLVRVGLAVAVANARPEAKKCAHYVTRARGGQALLQLLLARGLPLELELQLIERPGRLRALGIPGLFAGDETLPRLGEFLPQHRLLALGGRGVLGLFFDPLPIQPRKLKMFSHRGKENDFFCFIFSVAVACFALIPPSTPSGCSCSPVGTSASAIILSNSF